MMEFFLGAVVFAAGTIFGAALSSRSTREPTVEHKRFGDGSS